jgi:hypothetical protein
MTEEYPKPQPGRCELHNCRLYRDYDGYRCWSCERERIEAQNRKRAAPDGPNAAQVAWAQARCSTEVESVLRTEVVRQRARIAELERPSPTEREAWTRVLGEDTATLVEIEHVCAKHGYKPDSGQCVADWIAKQLLRLLELELAR